MNDRTGKNARCNREPRVYRQTPEATPALRRQLATIVSCLCVMVVAAGCASTRVVSREKLVDEQLPRPNQIWVYDFAATAAEVPTNSTLAGEYSEDTSSQTPEDIAAGRALGARMAAQLVEEIRRMGLPAEVALTETKPQVNDLVFRGYLLSINEGSTAKRVVIGFGSGASELRTAVEGYQMTAAGLRKLGSGTLQAGGGKSPGAAVGAATFIATANPAGLIVSGSMKAYGEMSGKSTVTGRAEATAKEIAKVLKQRFQEQGWIQ